ncbi:hypothetical protein [Pararhodospirillum photometricum]|uniref:phage tail tube protein n=1 Tax=Pararhodospirillum photometricum TaxID=1084 RepID=UPI0002F0C6A7|nr:hypothetical protein [Pararhodospirillum photometricum]
MAGTDNYSILKGIVSFTPAGTGATARDLGNCTALTYQPSVEYLDHYSSRSGVKAKDKSVASQVGATVAFTLDEFTLENLALGLGGILDASKKVLTILGTDGVEGALKVVGTNDVGRRLQLDVPSVKLKAGSSVGFITDEWAEIEIEGEVQRADGAFPWGKITDITDGLPTEGGAG